MLRQAELISFYWGYFSQEDIDGMQAYLLGMANHFSSEADAPSGQENVLRQYGVNGVSVGAWFWRDSVPAPSPPLSDADVRVKVEQEQADGNLPAFSDTRLFLIFTRGISHVNYAHNWCARHWVWDPGMYWALCPYPADDGCGSGNPIASWQTVTSHEIQEALTDPTVGGGWVEMNPNATEGGDVCAWKDVALSFGTIQSFADNRQQTCSVFTPELELWHTIRNADGTWTPFGDVEKQTGQPSSFYAIDSAAYQYGLHLCGTTGRDQTLWFTTRKPDGTWDQFFDAETMTGRIGVLEDVSIALVNDDLHVCVTDFSGGLWHSIRSYTNAIFTPWGDVKGQAGNRGPIARVSCAQVNGELHVCAVDTSGTLWHTIRHSDGTWLKFEDVQGEIGNTGATIDITVAEVAGQLHAAGITSYFLGHGIWHSIRHADTTWTPYEDLKLQCGDPGPVVQLDGAGVSNQFQLVVVGNGISHAIRPSTGIWTRFGNVKGQAGDKGAASAVACAGFNGDLQLAVTAQG